VRFNDRFSASALESLLRKRLDAATGRYDLQIEVSGEAFVTEPGPFSELLESLIERERGVTPELSTSGGTSDARFIKEVCPVVEFGLVGATIHQVDERVAVADLEALTRVYRALLAAYVRSV
jgi:succinyl-diaminopimelate desuccinylase